MIRAVHEHHNRFYYSQLTLQKERVDHDESTILLMAFVIGYSRSHKTTDPELSVPMTFF
jgi:hypothetical protein